MITLSRDNVLAFVIASILCLWPIAGMTQSSLVGSWLVTVEGDAATRTLIVTDEAPTNDGALLGAKYGMTSKGQGPIAAKMLRVSDQRQLILTTQAGTKIAVTEQSDGNFRGTFALKDGAVKGVTIVRIADEMRPQLAQEGAALPISSPNAQSPQSSPQSGGPAKVLFIGNSYTYYNNLPGIVSGFAALAGVPLHARAHTMPAAQLETIWGLRPTRYLLQDEKWDFVVLQEQSTLPLTATARMRDSIRTFDEAIRKTGAKTVLYITWARENLPDSQETITTAYVDIGSELGALIAPVGPAWRLALQADPKMPLFDPDGSHPSPTGSYLAACTLFLTISGSKQPCPALETRGVTASDAQRARQAAYKATAAASPTSQSPK